jgi:hypothetical protein
LIADASTNFVLRLSNPCTVQIIGRGQALLQQQHGSNANRRRRRLVIASRSRSRNYPPAAKARTQHSPHHCVQWGCLRNTSGERAGEARPSQLFGWDEIERLVKDYRADRFSNIGPAMEHYLSLLDCGYTWRRLE